MALDISEQAAAITVPVCVIVGSEDQAENEAALREAILPLTPRAKFETIEGVGHLSPLFFDKGPGEAAEAISDFLADLVPRAARVQPGSRRTSNLTAFFDI